MVASTGPRSVSVQREHARVPAEHLWSAYFASRSLDDRNRLVVHYAPLVRVIASRIARRLHPYHSVQELCSCGQFGLIDAIEKLGTTRGSHFTTYATIRIHGAIIDELRRDDIVPQRLRARVRTYHVARETLESDLRRTPSRSEVADYLNVTVADVVELEALATSNVVVSLTSTSDDLNAALAMARADPSECVDLVARHESIRDALWRLTERQRQVLVLHFLEGLPKSEVASVLGIDRSRVTQLLHRGLSNLRLELAG